MALKTRGFRFMNRYKIYADKKIMKHIKTLPFYTIVNGEDIFDCALWSSDKNICDLVDRVPCKGNMFFGTTDKREPKFCSFHFFTEVINKEADSLLVSEKEAELYL